MRVLILHSRYLSGPVSGENRVVDDEVTLLRASGHDVTLWDPSVEAHGAALLKTGISTIWSRDAASEVKRLIKELHPEVVHCHNLFPALSPTVIRAAHDEGVPVVMTLHNYRLMCLPATFLRDGAPCELCLGRVPWPGVKYKCHRDSRASSAAYAMSLTLHRKAHTFDQVDLFLATSGFVRDKHVEGGMDASKIVVRHNFSDPLPGRDGPGDYFLFLGRLSAEKGAAELVEAWRNIEQPLLIVGEGPERDRIAQLAPSHVELRDSVPFEEVPALLVNARAMCLPSLSYEGSPRGVLEAYAAGVPVIAHKIGSVPEFVEDGGTGILVDTLDYAGWREAVLTLADDAASAAMGARAAELWAEHYSPSEALSSLEAAYERVIR